MKRLIAFCSLIMVMAFSSNSLAGSGTLTATCKYKDGNGVDQPLSSAYIYLHDASNKPPMEEFFVNTPYIFGPSLLNGSISASVPEGRYYIRITKRSNPRSGTDNRLGPPEAMDYTWSQTTPITITASGTTNLGIIYANIISAPITVTGIVTNYYSGAPVTGRYVRAQTEPCYTDGYNYNVNQCGPVKYPALQRTDADGRYTIELRNPGTYYIYHTNCLHKGGSQYVGNPCMGVFGGSVTVNGGDTKTLNLFSYR